jgi:hypothetical protein
MSMVAGTSPHGTSSSSINRVEKGLQCADFFLTMTSAYSSLIKYQRESLEKRNLPGRAVVLGFISSIYSPNAFGGFCASADSHFANSPCRFSGVARVVAGISVPEPTLASATDLGVVTP